MSMLQHNLIDFSVEAYHDGALETIGKEDLLGHWSVLFFYPADFSFVCPTELEDLQDHYAEFKKAGCEIYSVSCDTQWVHKAWHDANEKIGKVQYPMLADTTGKLARDLKTYNEESGLAERGDFIIDPEGKVVASDTFRFTEVFLTVGAYYLIMVTLATWLLRWLERRFHIPGFGAR